MSDPIPASVTRYLAQAGLEAASVTALTPDASDRRYYRAVPPAGEPLVLALYAQPFDANTLPFLIVSALFAALPLPVPRVLAVDGALGLVVLEDLGDVTLQAYLADASDESRDARYRRAIDHLIVLQRRGRALASPACLPYTLAFDEAKLMWEMEFFLTHFVIGFRGVALEGRRDTDLRAELRAMVADLAALPRVLCHRDYHARNLMWHRGDLHLIDHQDARMGPDTYDLVSLLRDAYVELPATLIERLKDEFVAGIGERDRDAFEARFRLMALQRTLKALGTFGYQATARANPAYAQYVPRTLGYVRQNLKSDPRFSRLGAMLADLVPELG